MTTISKKQKRETRHNRIRAKVKGSIERPRLSVFRSNKALYAQLINDETGTTLVQASSLSLKLKGMEAAVAIGKAIAESALSKGVGKVVFDRGGFLYTGQIKALAEAAREGGLEF